MKQKLLKLIKISLVSLIIVKQTFLPINVLAEQLIEEVETNNYKISINETELSDNKFDIEESISKQLEIKQEYQGEEETYIFSPAQIMNLDYTNRLFGSYLYNLSVSNEIEQLDSKEITINYIGDNSKLINTNNIYYNNNTYYILGNITNNLTVQDIINKFNNNLSDYNATINLLDTENNPLSNEDIVEDNYQLNLNATYEDYALTNEINEYYKINIVEDINQDEIIDNKDIQKLMIEEILNQDLEEAEPNFNVIDATNILIDNVINDSIDELTTTFEYNNNIFPDEEITLNYYIEGFCRESLKGIEGNLKYDKNILELTSIEINSIDGDINEFGHFIYLLDNYDEDGLLLTFKFKALTSGITTINIDNITASTGARTAAKLDNDSFEGEITVLEKGIGGDIGEGEITPPEDIIKEQPEETIQQAIMKQTNNTYAKPILLSGDNLIKSLIIKGHEINFDPNTLEYQVEVKNNINSLELEIILNDDNASYVIEGNKDFKSGENIVKIIVTAENGNEKTYTLKVNKESKEVIEEEIEEENTTSKAVIIFLIILVIIGLVYVIFKDDEEDKK